nr:transposase, MuDR [Tanacetum cinerariifolium]
MHYAGRFMDSPNKQYIEDFVNKHKMMCVYVEQVEKTKSSSDDNGEDDSESEYANDLVDEEHLVDDVEVNMSSFKFKIDREHDTKFIHPIQPHVNAIEDDLEAFDFDSLESDQEDVLKDARSRGFRKLRKKPMSSNISNNFYVGKKFPNRDLGKERIRAYAVETRRNLNFKRNDKRFTTHKSLVASSPTTDPRYLPSSLSISISFIEHNHSIKEKVDAEEKKRKEKSNGAAGLKVDNERVGRDFEFEFEAYSGG